MVIATLIDVHHYYITTHTRKPSLKPEPSLTICIAPCQDCN